MRKMNQFPSNLSLFAQNDFYVKMLIAIFAIDLMVGFISRIKLIRGKQLLYL